jgi:hypothetical protein
MSGTPSKMKDSLTNALVMLVVQFLLYAVTVRDDVRDLKREFVDVRCEMAVGFRRPILPSGCNLNTAVFVPPRESTNVVQSGSVKP